MPHSTPTLPTTNTGKNPPFARKTENETVHARRYKKASMTGEVLRAIGNMGARGGQPVVYYCDLAKLAVFAAKRRSDGTLGKLNQELNQELIRTILDHNFALKARAMSPIITVGLTAWVWSNGGREIAMEYAKNRKPRI